MDLDDLRALLSVIEHRSVLAAARATQTSRSTLRRHLDNLEAVVGVPLLVRDASGAVPTPAGEVLAARGRTLVEEASALVAAARALDGEPRGPLRVLAPVGLHPHMMGLTFALIRERLPAVEVRYTTSEDPLRELRDDVDLVLHFGPPPASGAWVTTTLLRTPERVVASPDYLQQAGTPCSLEEIQEHTLLGWRPPGEDGRRWPLLDGGFVEVSPTLVAADVHLVRQLAAAGHGLALVPDAGLPEAPDLGGELHVVLEDVVGRPNALRALVPEAMAKLPKGRALIELARELLAGLDELQAPTR